MTRRPQIGVKCQTLDQAFDELMRQHAEWADVVIAAGWYMERLEAEIARLESLDAAQEKTRADRAEAELKRVYDGL